jgi:hypothetical protein
MFCEESYSCNSQPAQYFKKKSTKIILEKQKKKHKNDVGKHCSNPQCFKEKKLQS